MTDRNRPTYSSLGPTKKQRSPIQKYPINTHTNCNYNSNTDIFIHHPATRPDKGKTVFTPKTINFKNSNTPFPSKIPDHPNRARTPHRPEPASRKIDKYLKYRYIKFHQNIVTNPQSINQPPRVSHPPPNAENKATHPTFTILPDRAPFIPQVWFQK